MSRLSYRVFLISSRGLRRVLLAMLALGHALLATGFPLPSASAMIRNNTRQLYPCQSRACGCGTAQECWKGDCCCFTLEEKLRWADSQGIEPPAHVRPLVESRKQRIINTVKKPAATCCQAAASGSRPRGQDCSARSTPTPATKDEASTPRKNETGASTFRWVISIEAQKCRGEENAGMFQFEPVTPPQLLVLPQPLQALVAPLLHVNFQVESPPFSPPTPPPRHI